MSDAYEHDDDVADEQIDELVLYLDGELPTDQAADVEKRLAQDPQYRERLKRLQKSWDLLDQLPKTAATEAFTRSTLELVAVTVAREVEQSHVWENVRTWRNRLLPVAAVASFAFLGYAITYSNLNRRNANFVKDADVIKRIDKYEGVDDLNFLVDLHKSGLFQE